MVSALLGPLTGASSLPEFTRRPDLVLRDDDGKSRVRDGLQVRFNVASTTSSCPSCDGAA